MKRHLSGFSYRLAREGYPLARRRRRRAIFRLVRALSRSPFCWPETPVGRPKKLSARAAVLGYVMGGPRAGPQGGGEGVGRRDSRKAGSAASRPCPDQHGHGPVCQGYPPWPGSQGVVACATPRRTVLHNRAARPVPPQETLQLIATCVADHHQKSGEIPSDAMWPHPTRLTHSADSGNLKGQNAFDRSIRTAWEGNGGPGLDTA